MANKALFFISESCSPSSHKLPSAVTSFAHTASALRNSTPFSEAADARNDADEAAESDAPMMISKLRSATNTSTPSTIYGFTLASTAPLSPAPAPSSSVSSATPPVQFASSAPSGSGDALFQKRHPTVESKPSLLSRQLSSLRSATATATPPQTSPPVSSPSSTRRHRVLETDVYAAATSSGSAHVTAYAYRGSAPPPAPSTPPLINCSESLKQQVVLERESVLSQLQRRIGSAVSSDAPVAYFSYKPESSIGW